MTNIALSILEKAFILNGVEDDFRSDGRNRQNYRPMELETDVVSHASGSARMRLANTDIIVAIKSEIDTPNPYTPERGKLEFFVDCSANATPEFEGRGGEELAFEISNTLQNAYEAPKAFNYKSLCLVPGQLCWKLYVDILILECGGNLFDAVSLAVKAALFNTKLPRLTTESLDGKSQEIILPDSTLDYDRLDISCIPLLATACKIGKYFVIDPSIEEEECSSTNVVIGICQKNGKDFITNIHTCGEGSFHHATLNEAIELGISAIQNLNKALVEALNLEEEKYNEFGKKKIFGFLK